jgi:nitric oxide reductase activation protein
MRYPEWDTRRGRYRPDWCLVRETDPVPTEGPPDRLPPIDPELRRALAQLGLARLRYGRQPSGDDIDLDAAVDAEVSRRAGAEIGDRNYVHRLKIRPDLSVMILIDASASTGHQRPGQHRTVFDHQVRTRSPSPRR